MIGQFLRKKSDTPQYEEPFRVYSDRQILKACYTEKDSLISWSSADYGGLTADIGNEEKLDELLRQHIRSIIRESEAVSEHLISDYGFKNISSNRDDSSEVEVLLPAYKQALALIYYNPVLRSILSVAHNDPTGGRNMTSAQTKYLLDIMENVGGLPVHIIGDNEQSTSLKDKNLGSLVSKDGKITLEIRESATSDVVELAHEYAAFAFIRASNGNDVTYKDEYTLKKDKRTKLRYVLIFIDMIASSLPTAVSGLKIYQPEMQVQ